MTLDFGSSYNFGQGINRYENLEQYDLRTLTTNYIENGEIPTLNQTSLYTLQEQFTNDLIEIDKQVVYYFDVINSHKIQLQSQITDYWLEDSTAVQDSINISPIIINLTGLVGEVVYSRPNTVTGAIVDALNRIAPSNNGFTLTSKLGTISSLIPVVDNYTQLAKNAIMYTESAFKRYKKVYDQIKSWRKGSTSNTIPRQQQIYEQFELFWKNKTSLIVNTPYGVFENMYIQNVTMEQGETNTVSNVSVTLKQLTFADVKFTAADKSVLEKYNSNAQAEEENLGPSKNNKTAAREILQNFGILPENQKYNRKWKE